LTGINPISNVIKYISKMIPEYFKSLVIKNVALLFMF